MLDRHFHLLTMLPRIKRLSHLSYSYSREVSNLVEHAIDLPDMPCSTVHVTDG